MNVSRDDFVIAIRSAFLKKQTKQKFSLLSLIILSIFILFLSSLNLKVIKITESGIKEFIIEAPQFFLHQKKSLKILITKLKVILIYTQIQEN